METDISQSRTPLGGWTSSLFRKRSHRGESPSGFTPHRESKRFKFNSRKSYSRSLTCLSSQVKGQLKVAVYKNSSRVLVDVLEASFECVNHNLSTYVQVSLETRDEVLVRKFTQLQKKNNKPAYKEVFWFSLSELQPGRRIVLTVFESVQKSSIFIGSMSFGVKHILTNNKASYGWFYLLEAETGRRNHLAVPSQPDTSALRDMNGREKQKNNILPRLKVFNNGLGNARVVYNSAKPQPANQTILNQEVMLSRDHRGKYGFKFQNTLPASVGKVQPGGPASLAGVKEGDTFLELDGFNVAGASPELISTILKQSTGYVTALLQRTAECMSPMPTASQPKKKKTPLSRGSFNLFYRTSTGGRKYISSPGLSSPMQRASLSSRKKLDKNRVFRMSPYTPLLHRRLKRELAAKVALRQSQLNLKGMSPKDGDTASVDVTNAAKRMEGTDVVNGDCKLREKLQYEGDTSQEQLTQHQEEVSGDIYNHLKCPEGPGKERVSLDPLNSKSCVRNEQSFAGEVNSQEELTTAQDEVSAGEPLLPGTIEGEDQESEVGVTTEQSEASSSDVLESKVNITITVSNHDEGESCEESHIHKGKNSDDTNLTEGERLSKDVDELVERICHRDDELQPDAAKVAEGRCLQEYDKIASSSVASGTELPQNLQMPLRGIEANESPNHSTSASLASDKDSQSFGSRLKVKEELPNGGSVSFVDGVEPFPLSTPARDVVHVDRLLVQREGKKLQKLVVLLLSDIMVFGKLSTTGHFKIVYDPLHLDDISWLDSDCRKVSEFRILLLTSKHPLSSRGGSISFTAPSQTCKRIWMRHLQERLLVVKYQGLKKRTSSERNLIPMESNEEDHHHHREEEKQLDPSEKTGSPRHEDGCAASAKYSTNCAMESNNNSNSESNHYSRLLSELSGDEDDMPSLKCNGPTTGLMDRETSLALPHVEVAGTAEKWSEGLRMPSSSSAPSNQVRADEPRGRESPSDDEEEASSSGDGEEGQNSFSHTNFSSPVSHSHSNSCQLVQSTQSTPTVSHRESFKRAKSAPSISPNSPMACLAVKHPEKKLVRRQSSPPGALKENNSVSIRSKFRKTIFRRFTGTGHREENNVQSVTRDNKKDMKKTKRGFHTFSSSPQLNVRLSDNNSSSLQRIPNEEMVVGNDVETRSLQDQPIRKTKSIAKEIKAKVQFLRRRHTEGSLQETEENVNPATKTGPDLEDIRRWADGFESLLKDEFGLEAFRKFLQTEFSDENIEFWLACEEYKDLKPSKMVARAHKIYEDYVTIQAPREVNLDSRTRLQVVSNLSHPNKHSFEQAQKRIEALMEKDSYPRFLRSDIYIKLQKAAKKNK